MSSLIVTPEQFNPENHMIFTKPKVNASGGKSIGILNSQTRRAIQIQTPLMLTWGANVYENQSGPSYSMSLQFPREEFSNDQTDSFLNMLKSMENTIIQNAQKNSKEWFGKAQSKDVIDAFWNPILKYPKGEDGEPDKSRSPTLKIKLPAWEGDFKFELYDVNNVMLLPNSDNTPIETLIPKGCNMICLLQCGGLWFANGNFGITWRLTQGVVKPTETLEKGKCHISISNEDKKELSKNENNNLSSVQENNNVMVESDDDDDESSFRQASDPEGSEDEDEEGNDQTDENDDDQQEQVPEPEPAVEEKKPKKKRVVKKKV